VIIHEPEVQKEGEEVSFFARVEFKQPVQDVPDRLWFKFAAKYEDWLSEGSEAFAAALLLTAMYWGEDIEIRGSISPKFAYGFEEYKNIFHLWQPDLFQGINLSLGLLKTQEIQPTIGKVLSAFSGGVDSTFTLMNNLPNHQNLEGFQISHGFFLQGIDYAIEEVEAYQSALRKYANLFDSLGLELISVRTNAGMFSRYRLDQAWTYGGILIGTGLALGGGFPRFYVPSGHPYTYLHPVGSLPLIDHLLSTNHLEVIHHGAAYGRFEKIEQIADWEVAQQHLRVCTRRPKEMHGLNCSTCGKCLQTMIRLDMMGTLSKFTTFTRPFTMAAFIPWATRNSFFSITVREMMKQAIRERKWHYLPGLVLVQLGGITRRWLKRFVPRLLGRERVYRLKRRFYGRDR